MRCNRVCTFEVNLSHKFLIEFKRGCVGDGSERMLDEGKRRSLEVKQKSFLRTREF